MPSPHLLMAQVTNPFGEVESEPLVVRVEGPNVFLECEDGTSRMVGVDELQEAILPDDVRRVLSDYRAGRRAA